jgi:hypothetical protein
VRWGDCWVFAGFCLRRKGRGAENPLEQITTKEVSPRHVNRRGKDGKLVEASQAVGAQGSVGVYLGPLSQAGDTEPGRDSELVLTVADTGALGRWGDNHGLALPKASGAGGMRTDGPGNCARAPREQAGWYWGGRGLVRAVWYAAGRTVLAGWASAADDSDARWGG